MGKYNLFQQTFTLSMFSNGLTGITGKPYDLETKLTQQINESFSSPNIQSLIGNWKIVWGPVVFQANGSLYADNTMYVASNDENVYVVAIAGTNTNSLYDYWEDLLINPVSWHYSSAPSNVVISKGTDLGLSKLLAMINQGKTLAAFLKGISNPSEATIIFTGHSLGGALSPTLALALMSPGNSFGLDKNDWRAIYVYPTAGPTPGSDGFANFFSQVFPIENMGKEVWENWNSLVWNNLDLFPHNWNTETLSKIPYLYYPRILPDLSVITWVASAIEASRLSKANYTQLQNPGALSGTIKKQLLPYLLPFLRQVMYQHISAYYILLGLTEIMPSNLSEIEKHLAEVFANQLNQKFAEQDFLK